MVQCVCTKCIFWLYVLFCVYAGQRICSVGEGNVAGDGTYIRDGFIYANLTGYITRVVNDDKMVFIY